ncbi:MAG: exonuclease domain-containing protein [Flavobacteriales bacterium]|nr:3'-5' exonuclease [Crocinitomicaceae bacterium]|tara:strand:+ start:690 stop:1529 length:840 start_codon:yes stop_codon:yes gene_type:complete
MNISLKKSLAIFDIEATGLSITNDRIVEIAIVKIAPNGSRTDFLKRINPEIPIPKEVSEIHGIYDEDIKDAPVLKDILAELEEFIEDADFAGYNSNKFDLPMLAEELLRVGSSIDLSKKLHIDVQNIFHKMEQRTLIAAYSFYCNKNLENAHTALADAEATWEVLDAQIKQYDELESSVGFLADFSRYGNVTRLDFAGRLAYNEDGVAVYNFGKQKGRTIEEVMKTEPGYHGWLLNADFPLYTKQCLKNEIQKIKAKKSKESNPQGFDSKLNDLKNKFN